MASISTPAFFGRDATPIAARAGYDAYGLVHALMTLEATRVDPAFAGFFLETHPPVRERVDALYALLDERFGAQAVPSVAPTVAAPYFSKTECFCFTEQTLEAGEHRDMPVRFVVRNDLPPEVTTVTLSYTFFRTDEGA